MKAPHIITLILWAFGIVNLFEPFNGWIFYVASGVFYLLLIAHFIECLIYKNLIAKSPHGKTKATIYTMLFGVLYLRRIKPKN